MFKALINLLDKNKRKWMSFYSADFITDEDIKIINTFFITDNISHLKFVCNNYSNKNRQKTKDISLHGVVSNQISEYNLWDNFCANLNPTLSLNKAIENNDNNLPNWFIEGYPDVSLHLNKNYIAYISMGWYGQDAELSMLRYVINDFKKQNRGELELSI